MSKLTDVLHEFVSALAGHPDTAQRLHESVNGLEDPEGSERSGAEPVTPHVDQQGRATAAEDLPGQGTGEQGPTSNA